MFTDATLFCRVEKQSQINAWFEDEVVVVVELNIQVFVRSREIKVNFVVVAVLCGYPGYGHHGGGEMKHVIIIIDLCLLLFIT